VFKFKYDTTVSGPGEGLKWGGGETNSITPAPRREEPEFFYTCDIHVDIFLSKTSKCGIMSHYHLVAWLSWSRIFRSV